MGLHQSNKFELDRNSDRRKESVCGIGGTFASYSSTGGYYSEYIKDIYKYIYTNIIKK